MSANTTTWRDGWYVVDGNIVAENTINVYGTANLILKDGSKLTANRGIRVEEGSTLNVYAQIGGTGALVAKGYSEWTWNSSDGSTSISNGVAAIGASCNSYRSAKAGSVVIHGGKVTAEGDYETAGIGGSVGGSGGEVTIYGGEVTATGGSWAAGIGGGCEGDGGSVEIYGGTVVATGGSPEVAGIGKGSGGSHDGTVSLKDTNLEMRGGSDYTLPLGSGPCDNIESRDCHMRVVKTFHGDGIVSFVESSWDGTKVVKTAKETDSWDRVSPEVTSWSGGVCYVVESDVDVNERIMVSGTVNLVLGDGVKLTAPKGINLPSGSTLNIYAQQEGTGELVIEPFGESVAGAGIGGDNGQSGGSLVVHGGVVRVTGNQADQYGAGIGGGYMGAGGHVVVYDGTVEATGNPCGAGIGGGCFGAGGETVVYGGTVKGTCLYEAAGIGGGKSGDGGSLTVYGGTIEATGGTYSAGIGGGYRGSGGVVAIHDGKTSSAGGDYGSGVGGGYCGTCGEVNVYGGSLTATGGYYGAGIGSGIMEDEDNENLGRGVTISGGEVVATGGLSVAGIGGGALGSGAAVTITGGSVTAKGSSYAAGIGGGERGSGAAVTIEGGSIDAEGGKCAAGIGGGYMGAGGNVTVSGGSVIALGGNAGIGRGYEATENGVLSIADGLYVYGGEQRSSLLGTGPCENVEARKLFMSINGTIELALAKVEVAPGPYVYTGSQVTLPVTVEFGGVEVPASSYDVSYGENVHAGEGAGSVTVTAKESTACSGAKTAAFNIGKANNEIVGLSIEGWTYGEAAHTPTATVKAGEPVFSYADTQDGPWSPDVPTSAGNHWVRAEVAATDDYDGATATAQFTIAKASNKIVVLSVGSWTYGDEAVAPKVEAKYGSPTLTYAAYYDGDNNPKWSPDVPASAGEHWVKAEIAATDDYEGVTATARFTVLPKKLVVGNVTVANKAYDGTASAVIISKGALVGVVDGDDIHLDDAGATAWFENGDVGEDKNVFLSGYWLTGGSQHNYTLEQPTAKATIEKCKVSVGGIAAGSKTYDGTVETTVDPSKAVIVDLNGKIVAGDVRASVQDNKGEFDSKDAGMRKAVSCSVALEGADASSYVLDDSNGQVVARANILPLTAKLAWTDTQHTYDGEEHVPAASVTNKVGEDDVTVEVTGGQTDAGDYTATAARFGGADGGNYSLPKDGGATQAFSIARAGITPSVSIEGWIKNQRTNDSAPVVTGNPGDGNVTYEYKEKAAEAAAYKQYDDDELNALAAGDYTVRATIAETTNYNGGVATSDFEVWDIFATQSLTLSGTIGLNYFMDLSRLTDAERESCHMTFTLHGRTIKDAFDPTFKNDKGYYGFTCPVRSIEMAEDVEATFSWGEGNSVKRVGKVTDYFSAFEQVASQYDDTTCALVHSIADYGHYVQPFLARTNGWVVGDKYAAISCAYDWTKNTDDMWTGTEAEAAKEGTAVHTVTCDKTDGCGVNTITKSLVLDTGTDLRIYFACDEGVSLTSAKLENDATLPVEQAQDGRWIVTVRNISAHLMSATQDITVKTSTDGTVKVRLSALSWVYSALTYEPWKNDETSRNAAASIWRYAKAAEKYRSEHS